MLNFNQIILLFFLFIKTKFCFNYLLVNSKNLQLNNETDEIIQLYKAYPNYYCNYNFNLKLLFSKNIIKFFIFIFSN